MDKQYVILPHFECYSHNISILLCIQNKGVDKTSLLPYNFIKRRVDNLEEENLNQTQETETDKKEEKPSETPNETNLFDQIKQEYEEKIKNIVIAKDKEIQRRDNVIKELISGTQVEKPKNDIDIIIENIKKEREKQFKY